MASAATPSEGQQVVVRAREHEVRGVDGEGGFYTRFSPGDGSDPTDHYWPPGTGWMPADLPAVGVRARIRQSVERFPHFRVEAGAEGIVVEATDSLIALRMDEAIPGAEEWDNQLCWTPDDAADSASTSVAAIFYEAAETVGV